ncbi:metal ABC transporter solute-binding protein, Zn/Mn family [Bifidobacterium canis]|uniref:ABC transporter substrate-binding protein n=1 Tax=Bifidobacterium canis TaxID=2610880 RepID=A0A7K1J4Q2_9BIFI|nr:zinc ABC transporter substrate-binding protein [Bifidobacterium canis]MUH59638.1 ABC transporter substrate-binding protein [Bifidobacterium canis]
MKKLMRTIVALLAALATVFAVSACSSSTSQSSGNSSVITVIASANQWGSLAKELGGKYVDVTSILNSTNTDAHDYEPTTNDISKFQHAQVAIVNGAGYDEWASKATEQSNAIVINAADEGGKKTGDNPHVWFSAEVRNKTADAITAAYIKLMPAQKAEFEKLNKQWHTEENELEADLKKISQENGKIPYGATEAVADYLMQDMGMEDKTPQGYKNATSNESEPTASDIKSFTDALKNGDMDMLIQNSQEESPLSQQLVSAADSGNIPVIDITEQMPSKYSTLTEWMKAIAKQVQEAEAKSAKK